MEGLLARNHRVVVCCSVFDKELYHKFFTGVQSITVIVFDKKNFAGWLLLHPMAILGSSKKRAWQSYIAHTINKQDASVVHFEFSGLAVSYTEAIEKIKTPVVVSCRGSSEKIDLLVEKGMNEKLVRVFEKVQAIHCVSNDIRNIITPLCNQAEKIFVNRPAVNTTFFKREGEKKNNKALAFLSVGRLAYLKGYISGILACNELKKKGYHFTWTIIGTGEQQQELLFYIHTLGLTETIFLAGPKQGDQIKQAYEQSDIFLLPSFSEGIANVALEAMSMELPVVSTNCGGMPEVILDNENGLIAESYNPYSLAEKLELLLKDEGLRRRLGKAARNTVLDDFAIERQIDIFEEQYKKIVTF